MSAVVPARQEVRRGSRLQNDEEHVQAAAEKALLRRRRQLDRSRRLQAELHRVPALQGQERERHSRGQSW